MARTIAEISKKIKKDQAVIATAEETIGLVEERGAERAAGSRVETPFPFGVN